MLRDFEYKPSISELQKVLGKFGFKFSNKKTLFAILRFEVISPDSFMWRLLIDNSIYYLYAEDYVTGLKQINHVFSTYLDSSKWKLVRPPNKTNFKTSSPVRNATTYKEPADVKKLMEYTVDSGFDFVFLAKSEEDADLANFSEYAPNGFVKD